MSEAEDPIIPPASAMQAGAKGFTPGKYTGMPRVDYDTAPGVSNSMLKAFASGKKTVLGRGLMTRNALHCRLESKEKYAETYVVIKDVDLRSKDGKSYYNDVAKSTGKLPIREKEQAEVVAMFSALAGDPLGRKYIESQAEREVAIFANIGNADNPLLQPHQTLMKGIIDLNANKLWDLKTTWLAASREEFLVSIYRYGYHVQAALYRELAASVCDGLYKKFFWLILEAKDPYHVFHIQATNEHFFAGLHWLDSTLSLYERLS